MLDVLLTLNARVQKYIMHIYRQLDAFAGIRFKYFVILKIYYIEPLCKKQYSN